LPASVEQDIFTYAVPPFLEQQIALGSEVLVPFGSQTRLGYVLDLRREAPPENVRAISEITGQQHLETQYLTWLKQVSAYYLASLSQVVSVAIPRRLGARLQHLIQPLPDASRFLEAVAQRFGPDSEEYRFASFLVSATPQFKTRNSCQHQFGKRYQKWLQKFQKQGLVEITVQVQDKPEAKEQLTLTYVQEPEGLRTRQQFLLHQLRRQGGQALLQVFCEEQQTTAETLRRLEGLGALSISRERVLRRPLDEAHQSKGMQVLTPSQAVVFGQIQQELTAPSGQPLLLHGVTGSGKTEIYLHSLATVLARGQSGMFLVPEIALTPQMLRRCRTAFGEQVAVLHSGLSEGEYLDEWERVRHGIARVVVGARSAIFAPLVDLRLIVIDEEHESSYKQDRGLPYDARQLAGLRMLLNQGVLVLGSATPRLESYARAQSGKWHYLSLPGRVHDQPLPPVNVVDMRQEQGRGNQGAFSQLLKHQLEQILARQEQAILLLNRRGYAGSWLCRDCGEAIRCPICAVTLTYHQSEKKLKCHYCEHRTRAPQQCPSCQSPKIQGFGLGTQRLEEITTRLFPTARVLRLDRDTTSSKNAHLHILDSFGAGDADILIGTQMVAKGLDFPRVTLVGILAADQALTLPDFRASERTFQLLTQAAGRAGRSELPGRIVLQTYAPDHPAIVYALQHDYPAFFEHEIQEREQLQYPPYAELVRILFADPHQARAMAAAQGFAQALLQREEPDLIVLGPIDAPLARLQSLYRVHVLLKHPQMSKLKALLRALRRRFQTEVQRLFVDVDPYSML